MKGTAARHLRDLVNLHGLALTRDPRRLRSMLADHCPELKREIAVLIVAVECSVPEAITAATAGTSWEVLEARLRLRMESERAIDEAAATWAVRSWAAVLGKLPDGLRLNASSTSETSTTSNGMGASPPMPSRKPILVFDSDNDSTVMVPLPSSGSHSQKSGTTRYLLFLMLLVLAGGTAAGAWYYYGLKTTEKPAEDSEIAHDWADFQRAALTTGSRPLIRERAPRQIDLWKKSADAGNERAMVLYAWCLQEGMGVPRDPAEAVRWLRKAADAGQPLAISNLGWCYFNGKGVAKDIPEAVRWFQKGTELNEPLSMNNLAWSYIEGTGVTADHAEAMRLFQLSADQGYARAMYSIGLCCQKGHGRTKDLVEAVKWFRKAADLGAPYAMNELGKCYEFGTGVTKDLVEAEKWHCKAAQASDVTAMVHLAGWMIDGYEHITRSPAEALDLLHKASVLDEVDDGANRSQILELQARGGLNLARDEIRVTRYGDARKHLEAARDQSITLNRERPGRFYFMNDLHQIWLELGNLERTEGHFAAAAECYRKAMEVDGPEMTKATLALADLLEKGDGVPQDTARAEQLRTAFNKQQIKKFTLQCKIGIHDQPFPVHVYVFEVFPWQHPLETQNRYFKEERGFEIPKDKMDEFARLYKIAQENNGSFLDLCVYALGDKKD